jgi:integral membrane protein (TIGR01906 family)
MNKRQLLITATIPLSFFLVNIFLILAFLNLNPNFLIHNKTYKSEHQTITTYLFAGDEKKLEKALPKNEYLHIKDVRKVLVLSVVTLLIIGGVTIKTAISLGIVKISHCIKIASIMLPIVIVCILLIFNQFFLFFHQVFFPQGNWSFSESSILIQLYPEEFWVTCTAIILATILIELLGASIVIKNRLKNTNTQN